MRTDIYGQPVTTKESVRRRISWINTALALLVLALGWVSFPMARILTDELRGRDTDRAAADNDALAGKNRKLARVTIAGPDQNDLRFTSPGVILPPLPEEPLANYLGAQAPVVTVADAAVEAEGRHSLPEPATQYVPSLVPGRGVPAFIADHASGFTSNAGGGGGFFAPGGTSHPFQAPAAEDSGDHSAPDAVTGAASKGDGSSTRNASRGDSNGAPSAASVAQVKGGTDTPPSAAANGSPAPQAIAAAAAALAAPPAVVEAATAAASELVSAENGIVTALADPDVPEPPMLLLTGLGLALLAQRLRRRQQIG